MTERSEELRIPVENLLTPDTLRKLCFEEIEDVGFQSVSKRMLSLGARRWQVELLAEPIANAILLAPEFVEQKSDELKTD